MIGAIKPSTGFAITSTQPTEAPAAKTPTAEQGQSTPSTGSQSKNPILRALQGESGFEGVGAGLGAQGKGKGLGLLKKMGKMGVGKGEQAAKPEESLTKLLQVLQQIMPMLQQLLGQQNGKPATGEGKTPAEGAPPPSAI
jgi:hypothetical protein